MGLTQTFGLDDVVTVGNTSQRLTIFKHATAGSTSLRADVTSSAGVGNCLDLYVDGSVQCSYGLFSGVFHGFAAPNDVFFGLSSASAYILITPSTVSYGGTLSGGPISCTSLTSSALTSGRYAQIGTAGILQDSSDATYSGSTSTFTKSQVKAGTSSSNVKVGGVLSASTTAVGNVGTGEDDLITYSVPANTLATNLDYIEFDMFFTFAANANTKRVKIKYGATTLFDTTALVLNAVDGRAQGIIIRTGATTQKAICTFTTSTTLLTQLTDYTTPGETLSGAVTLKATGEATSNNDVSQEVLIVKSYTG